MRCIKYVIIGFSAMLVVSCTRNPNTNIVKTEESAKDTVEVKSDNTYYLFPSPDELLQLIGESGAEFSTDLINSNVSAGKYVTQSARNINIGTYLADLAYCALFQKHTETNTYIDLIGQLSERIYLSPELKAKLNSLKENGIKSIDSASFVSGEFFYNIITDLQSSEQGKTVAEISAGSYVESLYLSLSSFNRYDPKNPVFKHLAEQQFAFKSMLAYCKQFENETEISELIDLLTPIEKIYGKMQFASKKIRVMHQSDSTLVISGGIVYNMNEAAFLELKAEVVKLRLNLINRQ
jgi:hypothetical protein